MAYGNQTLGRGEVHFSRFRTGTKTPEGFRYLGNTPEMSLTIDNQTLDHFNSDRGVREKDKSIVIETNRSGAMTCDDIQLDNLAYFFFGTAAVLAQTSATGATETLVDVIPGRSYQLGVTDALPTGVRSVTITSIAKGATTFVAGTDYLVDPARGLITILESGAIKVDDDLVVTYSRANVNRNQVVSGSSPVEGSLRFISYNPEGVRYDYTMPYVRLSPNGDFALKGEDWQTIPFTLEILRLGGREAIYIDGQPFVPVA